MEHEKNSSQLMIMEISKLVSMKRGFLIETLEDLISGMQSEYGSVLNQKEMEIALLRKKEDNYLKDIQGFVDLKNDLLASLEVETKSHKRTLEILSIKDRQSDEHKKEIEHLRQKLSESNAIMDALTAELQNKSEIMRGLQEFNETLKAENDLVKDKYAKMKGFIDKGGAAYSQTLKQAESDRLSRSLGEHKNIDSYLQNDAAHNEGIKE